MNKCLIVINRPVLIMYFYGLWKNQYIPLKENVDFFVNQSCLNYLESFRTLFDLPTGKVYAFEEPTFTSPYYSYYKKCMNLVNNFFQYYGLIKRIKDIPLADYKYLLTFSDDMLHLQFLIFDFKKRRKAEGLVFLADNGVDLYLDYQQGPKSLIRRIIKKVIFPKYAFIPAGCNRLVDIILARIPEKCNCSNLRQVRKIDYRIGEEDFGKWCEVFGVDWNALMSLKAISNNTILFLGTPFEELGISHDEIIEFLYAVKELEKSDIIIKPHPKEDFSSYKGHFDLLPSDLPVEILLGGIRFKFVLSYCSSALIESSLYGQQTYYFNPPSSSQNFLSEAIIQALNIHLYNLIEGSEVPNFDVNNEH